MTSLWMLRGVKGVVYCTVFSKPKILGISEVGVGLPLEPNIMNSIPDRRCASTNNSYKYTLSNPDIQATVNSYLDITYFFV